MGWSIGYDTTWNRDIGYGVPAYCDHPGCREEIHRGLAYVCCGSEPYGGDNGCGRFYCSEHEAAQYDEETEERVCGHGDDDHTAPEHPDWINWKLTDDSWQRWRDENPGEVLKLREAADGKAC